MPKLLQFTSILFSLPLILAKVHDQHALFVHGLGLVICTSWIYHGNTKQHIVKIIDITIAHGMVALHVFWGMFVCSTMTLKVCTMLLACTYAGIVHYGLNLNTRHPHADVWHATIHLALTVGSSALMCEPLCSMKALS